MVLFADDTGTGLSLLGIAMCAVNGLFLWLGQREKNANERDRMVNDVKMARLEDKVTVLTAKTDECHEERDGLKREIAQLRDRMDRRQGPDPGYRGPERRAADDPS